MNEYMKHDIVIAKYSDKGIVFESDEILLNTDNYDGRLMATASNGTIRVEEGKFTFGPNCPNGLAVYERIR